MQKEHHLSFFFFLIICLLFGVFVGQGILVCWAQAL